MVRQRVRIRFCKQGDLRLIGHRDLMRCFERLFRRAGLPLGMSQGFHPKPRVTFPSALPVGIEGTDEVMELELAEACTADQVLSRLRPLAPPGLVLTAAEALPEGSRKARLRSASYQVRIPAQCRCGLAEKIDRLLAASACPYRRPDRSDCIDLRPCLQELVLAEDLLRMRLGIDDRAAARPQDVLAVLGLGDLDLQGVHLTRHAVEIER
jgi:radical SAM-linked protein